jgi:hypothetical protein
MSSVFIDTIVYYNGEEGLREDLEIARGFQEYKEYFSYQSCIRSRGATF